MKTVDRAYIEECRDRDTNIYWEVVVYFTDPDEVEAYFSSYISDEDAKEQARAAYPELTDDMIQDA